jgi:hypothetical protein
LKALHARAFENCSYVVEAIYHAANERQARRVVRRAPVTILLPPLVSIKKKEKVVFMESLPEKDKNIRDHEIRLGQKLWAFALNL